LLDADTYEEVLAASMRTDGPEVSHIADIVPRPKRLVGESHPSFGTTDVPAFGRKRRSVGQ